nr:hypothetical protein [uncultured Gellertiella sp.]
MHYFAPVGLNDRQDYGAVLLGVACIVAAMVASVMGGWVILPADRWSLLSGEYASMLLTAVGLGGGALWVFVASTMRRLRDARLPLAVFFTLLGVLVSSSCLASLPLWPSPLWPVVFNGLNFVAFTMLVGLVLSLSLVDDFDLTTSHRPVRPTRHQGARNSYRLRRH